MSRLALYLFGPPRIERDGLLVTTDTRKAVALMAYLATTRQPHSRDTLAALLWPDYDQPHARATLRRTLSALHKALAGEWLHIERETISLEQRADFWLDVAEFRTNLATSQDHHKQPEEICAACLELLNRALALYSDDFMAGFSLPDSAPFDDWQFYQADNLRHELASALEQLALFSSAHSDFSAAINHTRRLLTLDRLHEPAHRYLMQFYTWSGQRSLALHQYQECVRILDEELGVAPLEATTQIYEAIKGNRLPPPPAYQQQSSLPSAPARSGAETSAAEVPAPLPTAGSYPLVGRQDEWAALEKIYTDKAPTGYVVALEGEAGIGKTRLAEEFAAYAKSRGSRFVSVRCYEGEADLAYGPIVAGLRTAIGQQADAGWQKQLAPHWLSEAARLVPELASLRADLPPPLPLENPGAQSRFFEGLLQVWLALYANAPATAPGILFFDDVHWADDTSLEFLSYLARRLDAKPLCLLIAWRNSQRPMCLRFRRLLIEAQHHNTARIFTLARLDQASIEQLLQRLSAAGTVLPHGMTRHLHHETEGVPLFLTEYLAAIASGALGAEDDEWSLPGGVRDLLASRLMLVSETSRQILGTAAVIGRSFDFDTLREVSGRSEDETVSGLEELINQGLVEEMRGDEGLERGNMPARYRHNLSETHSPIYDFCHEKVRSLVYEEVSLARQRLLHRRTAEALVARQRGQREASALASQIAHHYEAAGNPEIAADYFRLAGERARSLYAHTEALAHFRAALALGHSSVAYLREAIGDSHTFLGEYEAALKSYLAAQALNEAPQTLATLEQKQGMVCERRGKWEQAEEHFAAALRFLGQSAKEGLAEEQARVYANWSLAAHHRGQIELALKLAQQALELAERAGDTRALAQAHNMLGILANSRDEMERARFHLERSLALAENLQDASIRAAALNNLALACKASGDIAQAISLTETALALCASQGDRHRQAALHSNLADLFHEAERTEDAMSQLKLAARIYSEIDVEAGTMRPEIWKLVEW